MAKQHGVTANTFKKIVIDAGAVYANYVMATGTGDLLGATRGGNTFTIETEIKEMEVDGAIGMVKDASRIIGLKASLTANFVELTETLMSYTQPASTVADYPDTPTKTHGLLTRAADIATADYLTNVAIVGNSTISATSYIVLIIENPLADGNLEMSMNPKDESVIPVTFSARFATADLVTEPWKIYFPSVDVA